MKIAIIGAGNMGGAIARGLASLGQDMELAVANPSQPKLEALREYSSKIQTFIDNAEAANGADMLILAVKPWLIEKVLREIDAEVDLSSTMIVSVAAGVSLDDLASFMTEGEKLAIFIAMPNTAIAVRQSMTFVCHNANATAEQVAMVKTVFDAMGQSAVIEERQMTAATALCSCGIAFAMRYVRAATEGGVELGIYAHQAKDYVLQTLRGAVELLEATGNHPEAEIDRVTTPGGITIRGLNAMEAHGFTNAVIQGLKASK